MDLIRLVIHKPVSVTVGVILVVMFGLIGLGAIPIQLAPNVDRPIVTVTTQWPGRSPDEIVDRITKEQEETLKNVSNLRSMHSVSRQGEAAVTLEFYVGSDVGRALQEVSDSLRQVPEYPPEVDEPVIKAAEGASENAIAWMMVELKPGTRAKHPDFDITTLYDALDKEVKPYLERIDGVAEVNIYGGRKREARVMTNAEALARHGLTFADLVEAMRAENENVSAGAIAEGKRDYRVRVLGRYETAEQVLDTVVAYRDGSPIHVRDVAQVEIGYVKLRGFVRSLAGNSIAMNVIRQNNANVMEVMKELRERLDDVRERILPNLHPTAGPDLQLRQVYDETTYITSAIDLVMDNLWIGGALAAVVLLLFLRSFVSTGIIALAIPISVIGTFLVLLALGRTLNVISLAGLAFAVGMVVDNAIVVLENTQRRLELGDAPRQAAHRGGREVWLAMLASTLTTVAVFIPVLTIQEESGQLFRDISLAIVASVLLSLVVAVTVIPAACAAWMRPHRPARHGAIRRAFEGLLGLTPLCAAGVNGLARMVGWLNTGWRSWSVRPVVIVAMTIASLYGAWRLAPPLDYLPPGNRNLVFGGLLIPPGYSVEEQNSIAERIEGQLKPYVEANINDPASVAALPPIPRFGAGGAQPKPFDPVPVENFFIGSFSGGMFTGATSQDPNVVIPIGQLLTNAMNTIPDAFGGARQSSLFGRGVAGGNTINLEISGPRLDRVTDAARFMFGLSGMKYGFQNVRPDPVNFNLAQPEWRLQLNAIGRETGLRTRDIGLAARALFDGAFVGDFTLNGDAIDLVVLPPGGRLDYKERIRSTPITTPSGRTVPLDLVASIVPATAPQEIQRIEELPSVTVLITPPNEKPLAEVMDEIRAEVVGPAQSAGMIDQTMRVRLEGTAAKLDEVKAALIGAPPPLDAPPAAWQRVMEGVGLAIFAAGAAVGLFGVVRAARARVGSYAYGAVGALLLAVTVGGLFLMFGAAPQLATARLVWTLMVTYLLMAALFESFVYPFVIMFTVPLAIVGGFAGLRVVHEVTMANPVLAPQQLDVITMLGFIILVGVVVNNAILLVHQSLNFMRGAGESPEELEEPMPMMQAISEAVRTRVRPILMTTLTSVLGMLPLALFPGAGSELYRGLGAVVIGGLIVSTVFTLVLVPLLFGLVLQMSHGLRALLSREGDASGREPEDRGSRTTRRGEGRSPAALEMQPA